MKPCSISAISFAPAAAGVRNKSAYFKFEDVRARPKEFVKKVTQQVLMNKSIRLQAVMLMDAPRNPQDLESFEARFEMMNKYYYFHFINTLLEDTNK